MRIQFWKMINFKFENSSLDTSSLIDSWRGSETLKYTGNQNMPILGAHRPRPLDPTWTYRPPFDSKHGLAPSLSTIWRFFSSHKHYTFDVHFIHTLHIHTDTWNSTADLCLPCTCVTRLSLKYVANIFYKNAICWRETDGLLRVATFSLSFILAWK